jgi:hypothetical protein
VSSLDYRALSNINAERALTFQPLLFSKYWNALDKSKSIRILDFGAMQPTSIDFYSNSEVPCFITLTDCINSLSKLRIDEESSSIDVAKSINKLIQPDESQPYDFIMFWESLNYIHPDIFSLLHDQIKQVSHANTLLYGYLYTSNNAVGFPCNFKMQSESSFTCEDNAGLTENLKLINSFHLKKYFYDFEVSRSVLIRNGLQEFLMKRKP